MKLKYYDKNPTLKHRVCTRVLEHTQEPTHYGLKPVGCQKSSRCLKNKEKVYTLKNEINGKPTADAHYKFIKAPTITNKRKSE